AYEGTVREWREKGKLQNCRKTTAQVDDEPTIALVCNPTFCWQLRLLMRSLFILLSFSLLVLLFLCSI
ncbi:hypothetical protein WN51_10537, partial [Melipona quadrifasciata]